MPSVMDTVKLRDKLMRLSPPLRNQLITDSVSWLESDERPKCKAEHHSFLIDFENALQSLLNQQQLDPVWFTKLSQTYGSFPFFDRFVRRTL